MPRLVHAIDKISTLIGWLVYPCFAYPGTYPEAPHPDDPPTTLSVDVSDWYPPGIMKHLPSLYDCPYLIGCLFGTTLKLGGTKCARDWRKI